MGFFDFLKKNTSNQTDPVLSFPQQENATPIATPSEPVEEIKETESVATIGMPDKDEVNKQLEEPIDVKEGVEDFTPVAKDEPQETGLGESIEFEEGEDMTDADTADLETTSDEANTETDSETSTDTDSSFDAE